MKETASLKPAIIEGLDIGPCTDLWTLDYLTEKLGPERELVIHECSSDRMTFVCGKLKACAMKKWDGALRDIEPIEMFLLMTTEFEKRLNVSNALSLGPILEKLISTTN